MNRPLHGHPRANIAGLPNLTFSISLPFSRAALVSSSKSCTPMAGAEFQLRFTARGRTLARCDMQASEERWITVSVSIEAAFRSVRCGSSNRLR